MNWNTAAADITINPKDSTEDILARVASVFQLPYLQIWEYTENPAAITLIQVLIGLIKDSSLNETRSRNTAANLEIQIERLNQSLDSVRSERDSLQLKQTELQNSTKDLMSQHEKLRTENKSLKSENKELLAQNRKLTEQLNRMKEEHFGVKSEKTEQLFEETMDGDEAKDPLGDEESGSGNENKDTRKSDKENTDRRGSGSRKPKEKGKRKEDLSKLPVQVVYEYDMEQLNKEYGENNWRFAFWNERTTVECIRITSYVKKTYTPVISYGLEHSMAAVPFEGALFQKSILSSSLLSNIAIDKFSMYTTLYRMEHDENRYGFFISRQTLSNWLNRAAMEFLIFVYQYLIDLLASCKYQQCDETTWRTLRDGRKAGAKSFFWVQRTSELQKEVPPIVLYILERTRNGKHLDEFFQKVIAKGEGEIWLVSDAYGAYISLAKRYPELFMICGCFSHCRRKFVYALELLKKDGIPEARLHDTVEWTAISLINNIFDAEEKLLPLSPEERYECRQTKVKGLVDEFFEYVKSLDPNEPSFSDLLKTAINYSLYQEERLRTFLKDGSVPCHNNGCERDVKRVALVRKNSLFSNTEKGGMCVGIYLTLINTAKANGADPYFYIKYLLDHMPKKVYAGKGNNDLDKMMPWSEEYRTYETEERIRLMDRVAPESKCSERPRTPRKRDKVPPTPASPQAPGAFAMA